MKLSETIIAYLTGRSFSNGLSLEIAERESWIPSRIESIEEIVRNKTVIHLGCVDHLPLIKDKILNDAWLHSRLCKCAAGVIGIDVHKKGIEYVRDKLGYNNVYCVDITDNKSAAVLDTGLWDYLVIGEVLEHVDNPVQFLSAIRNQHKERIAKLVISAPNAFRWLNFRYAIKGKEFINSDHRFWFTPYTLAKIIYRAGLAVDFYNFVQSYRVPPKNIFESMALRRYPAMRDTIMMVASF